MKRYRHIAVIVCPTSFPIDMLRYEACHPRDERDSYKIATLLDPYQDPTQDDRRVEVERIDNAPTHAWNGGRWKSFNARLDSVRTEEIVR